MAKPGVMTWQTTDLPQRDGLKQNVAMYWPWLMSLATAALGLPFPRPIPRGIM